ncbi:hypothetical protein KSP39_PZI017118 [Platanthera zijinensis]|uniref:Retrovirus-related Pol polyprotein from transposon TNT 1-94-like beta-barrel domain-containing protein n=1 Tax=Platanthera zijinensis TaxID=2320716 RepID=A0AAP0FZU3_9ASPA
MVVGAAQSVPIAAGTSTLRLFATRNMATLLVRLLLLQLTALLPQAPTLRPSASSSSKSMVCSALHLFLLPPLAGMACFSSSPSWIWDSGVTHHITSLRPPKFSDAPHPKCITVANGAIVPVSGCDNLSLTPSISLRSTLYVPSSPFNLLSVGRLTNDMFCSVTFTSSAFLIQDRRTWITIGKGQLQNGLYLLDASPTILSSVSSVSFINWHHRVGHAPLPVL